MGKLNILISFLPPTALELGNDVDKWNHFISSMHLENEPVPWLNMDVSEFDKTICVLPVHDNQRLMRQQGAFFLFGIKNGNKSQMSQLNVSTIEMTIPKGGKEKLLNELDELGINESFCFPEIDKVAHYLNEHP